MHPVSCSRNFTIERVGRPVVRRPGSGRILASNPVYKSTPINAFSTGKKKAPQVRGQDADREERQADFLNWSTFALPFTRARSAPSAKPTRSTADNGA